MPFLPPDGQVRALINERFIATGAPPLPADIATELELTASETNASLERLQGVHAIVLERGSHRIEMAAPFSARPTAHVVSDASQQWFASCAWEALALLPLLERDGTIRSTCPDCAEAIELIVRHGETTGPAVFHISVPAARWWDDIRFT